MPHDRDLVERILAEARVCVLEEITDLLESNRATGYGPLYELLADYPFREGKGLRPAIVISAAAAAGGTRDQARVSAAALELYHNAFLVHDDVEDQSDYRRGRVTLLRSHGAAVAVNVGDATNVLAMQLLLRNAETIGLQKTLLVFREVERMARESVEGQAIELGWIAGRQFELDDQDYVRMAHKKTCWYTVIAPLRIGVLCGHPPGVGYPMPHELLPLIELGHLAGIAFQVSDDLLNLEADQILYGKEIGGDLWEGKRTIMLLHFLRTGSKATTKRATTVLETPREDKEPDDVAWMFAAMGEAGSLEYGRRFAREYAERALTADAMPLPFMTENADRRFLREMLSYVVERVK
ncbi:MAG TPA: polyprenyl synthetase family protein [Acidimicrobiia bacterium]|nr:polyprenyl synthetase family protein [Acidimicrobiia bacterium]